MCEIWKDIAGFENYQISNMGRVKSKERVVTNKNGSYMKSEKILKVHVMKTGYLAIVLRGKFQKRHLLKIHRLLAENFIPNPNNYPFINHIDGDKTNCDLCNLEWCTAKQNTQHAIETGLRCKVTGRNIQRIYKVNQETREVEDIYETFSEAARSNGLNSIGGIYAACNSKRNYRGFFWIKECDYKNGDLENFKKKRNSHCFLLDGEILNLKQYANKKGISRERVYQMIDAGDIKDIPIADEKEVV